MKTRCAMDTLLFSEYFFAHHCRLDLSRFHREALARHVGLAAAESLERRRGCRWAIAAPRGSAKTTLCSLILLLHDIVYQRERYVVVISATLKQAVQRLRNLKTEILTNETLRRVFGRELGRRGEFRAQSIQVNGVQIDAFGSGAEIRGITSGPWRPTKIILDDVEDSEGTESPDQREKLLDWFREVVENLGDTYTNLVVIGTVLHPESLLARLLKRPDYEGRLYRSIERFSPREELWADWRRRYVDLGDPRRAANARRFFKGHEADMLADTEVLWPAREDYYELMTQLVTRGRRAFYKEKQNEPLGGETSLFQVDQVARARVEDGKVVVAPRGTGAGSETRVALEDLRVVAFLDPALGRGAGGGGRRSARGDFAALCVVGASPDGALHALEMWIRRAPPNEQIRALFDAHERWRFALVGVEGNCFQDLLRLPLEQERDRRRAEGRVCDVPVEMVTHRRNKEERIAALEPLVSNGWLRFAETLPEEFWREMQMFPTCDHDDALDALEGAVTLARRFGGARRSPERTNGPAGRPPRGLREF